jgi:hypothetical protein
MSGDFTIGAASPISRVSISQSADGGHGNGTMTLEHPTLDILLNTTLSPIASRAPARPQRDGI